MTGNFTSGGWRLALVWLLLLGALPALAQVPPGNALNFDGVNDYIVSISSGSYFNYTVEAWVRTTNAATGDGGTIVSNYPNFSVGMYGGKARFRSYSTVNTTYDLVGTTLINDGKWHHVAAVMGGGINYNMTLYVDGVAEGAQTGGRTDVTSTYVGTLYGSNDFWQGSIDEVRIWGGPHSAAEIKTFFNNAVLPTEAGLLMNYTFDRGTAGGNNAGQTTEPNPVPRACGGCYTYTGTLYNFNLSGSTSNLIESYALMQPTNLAATSSAAGTSLSVTWTAPPVGTITNYVLDVSTTADYSAGVTTLTPAGGATSLVVSTAANTRYWLRLRADKTSVTGQSAYSRDVANLRTPSGLTAPGNSLAFDGTDDYVALPNTTPVPTGNGTYTLEAWIKPNAMGVMGIIGWGNWGTTNQVNALRLSPTGIINYWWGPDLIVNTPDLSGRWHHVAATFDGTTRTIYLDGVAVGSDTPGSHTVPSPSNLRIGCTNGPSPGGGYEYFNGSIDEVRIWNVARSAADMKAAYTSQPTVPQAGLVAAYDFDAGTAGGANPTQTTLFDRTTNYQDGTLNNFALTGPTSNWVESYALVVPRLAAPTALTTTGFTANWAAPLVGTVTGYVLDYSLSPTFATVAGTLSPAAGAGSQAVTGLLANRNYYYRLRADKSPGAVAGQGAYASGTVRAASGLTAPGNALAFDGSDDYVAVPAAPRLDNLARGSLTLESWVYCTNLPGVNSIIRKSGDYNLVLLPGGLLYAEVWPSGMGTSTRPYATATAAIPQSRWTHVAATWDGTALRLYVNGAAAAATPGSSPIAPSEVLQIGRSAAYNQPFAGRLDELRIYNAALTPAQILADMTSTSAAVPASLLLYYNFDQGTANGNNAGTTTLTDQTSTLADGTLTNFDLSSGNTTSNWVESYALVVPTLAAATTNAATSFVANWTAPAIGTVTNYVLDVATSNTFAAAALVSGSPFTVAGTSQTVAGLDPAQTYYYRVRADKAGSVTGQGAYSPIGVRTPFTPMTPPGNALAFDGSDDYVTGNNPQLPQGNTARTLEAWVLTTANGSNVVVNYGAANTNQRSGILLSNGRLYYVGEGNDLIGNKALNDGHWHHVAATYDGSTLKLYVDGVLDVSNAQGAFNTTGFDWNIGKRIPPLTSTEQFNGRLDEVRIYSTALTQAQVQADMTSTSPAVAGSLVAYYNFDQGTASGANAGYTTLTDQSANAATGTLTSFNLTSGNTTSNWVESYALLVPTGLTASASTGTGFTASWTAPLLNGAAPAAGIVEGYVLEVSPSSTFATLVLPFPVSGYGSTSVAATGLANGTDYYLRVRAEKATVTGQGDYSPTATIHTIGTDALLANLTASTGQLAPTFATATLGYTLYVPTGTSTYTLTPTASNGYTNITVNGTAVASGSASTALNVSALTTIVLTSEDGNATRTYTVQAVVAPGYFRSVATGNWGDASTWEASNDGSTGWFAAPIAPTNSFVGTVTVRNGHVVTVAATTSTKATTIESGGIVNTLAGQALTISGGATLTVAAGGVLSIGRLSNGTSGTSTNLGTISLSGTGALTVNGTLVLNTGSGSPTTQGINATTTVVNSGGRLIHFATSVNILLPVATWNAGSTLELGGGIANQAYSTSGFAATYQNVDVNLTGLPIGTLTAGQPYVWTGAAIATINGTLTIVSTGLGTLRLFNGPTTGTLTLGATDGSGGYVQQTGTNVVGAYGVGSASTTNVLNVRGSFQLNGGTFAAAQGSTTATTSLRANPLSITGTLSIASGATFNLLGTVNPTTAYTLGTVTLLGNVSNAGTLGSGNTASTGQKLMFAKAGTQAFANTGSGTVSGKVNTQLNSGTTLDLGTQAFAGTGTFTTLSGSTLRLGSPVGISLSGTATGNVQSTGTRTFGGVVEFNGTTAQVTGTGFPATLASTATLSFNNPAGVTLSQATSVPGTLSLKQGVVTTSATNLLALGTGIGVPGTLDPTTTNTGVIVGPFKRWIPAATGARTFPVGTPTQLRPATIDFTAAPTAGGSLTAEFIVSPSSNQGLPLTEGSITINKASASGYWRVAAADGLAGGTYTPSFTFTGASGILDYTQLVLLKRADPSDNWALVGTHVLTSGTNAAPVLSRTGVSGFSDFTAGGDLNVNPLPVELTAFTARAQGLAVVLNWTTASEKNSARFEVERSLSGTGFGRIGAVAAAGTSSSARNYELLDAQLPAGVAQLYYRLKQVDADGTFRYSPVRSVTIGGAAASLSLYPNPAHGAATLTGVLPGAVVTVYDALGRLVTAATVDAAGTAALALPAGLPAGVYVVRAGDKALRLTVE